MAKTNPEFYIAIGLVVLFFVILIVLIYLLLNPSHNVFDRIGKFFMRKKDKIEVTKTSGEKREPRKWFLRKK